MADGLEHAEAVAFEAPRALGVEAGDREPLSRHRDAVLASGVADVSGPDAGEPRQGARDLLGVAQPLLDPHEGMRALPRRRVERLLVHDEVLGAGRDSHQSSVSCETGANERRWIGQAAEATQGAQVLARRVAHVAGEAVARVLAVEARHEGVAVHLRDDRCGRDRGVETVAAHDRRLRGLDARNAPRVDEDVIGRGARALRRRLRMASRLAW